MEVALLLLCIHTLGVCGFIATGVALDQLIRNSDDHTVVVAIHVVLYSIVAASTPNLARLAHINAAFTGTSVILFSLASHPITHRIRRFFTQ